MLKQFYLLITVAFIAADASKQKETDVDLGNGSMPASVILLLLVIFSSLGLILIREVQSGKESNRKWQLALKEFHMSEKSAKNNLKYQSINYNRSIIDIEMNEHKNEALPDVSYKSPVDRSLSKEQLEYRNKVASTSVKKPITDALRDLLQKNIKKESGNKLDDAKCADNEKTHSCAVYCSDDHVSDDDNSLVYNENFICKVNKNVPF